jgi:hypothetical protein
MLARYTYHYDRKNKRLRAVEQPQIYRTAFADPQLELWELDDVQWRKVLERPARLRHAKPASSGEQLQLGIALLLILLLACMNPAR